MILFTQEEWELIKQCSGGILNIPEELSEPAPEEDSVDFFMEQLVKIFSKPIKEEVCPPHAWVMGRPDCILCGQLFEED